MASESARRATRQRALVLEAVQGSGAAHPTAEEVFARVRCALPRVSLGTVYRNLQRLVEDGRVGVAWLEGRVARYDPTAAPHGHFVCRDCGRVEDVPPEPPLGALRAAVRAGHDVRAHAVVLHGRCRGCRDGGA